MKIGLMGNQNSGKTTLFNCLTGMNSKIGNWPGVTIEKKEGKIKNTNHEIVDLPGIYSLSPYSIEEEISRKFAMEENPDLIINIVDATSLERSLYLTTQLMELDCKLIIALNMSDILEKKGLNIDIKKLENLLGVKIIKISALHEIGIDELVREISKRDNLQRTKIFDANIENVMINIKGKLNKEIKNKNFICVKLIEADERFKSYINLSMQSEINNLEKKYDTDMEEIVATERYNFIKMVRKETVKEKIYSENMSDKLDKIFLNKWIAFPIFVVIMSFIYYFSVGIIGKYTVDLISNIINLIEAGTRTTLEKKGCSTWINSLITDGIISGVGAVLKFIPQLMILFFCIAILETTGYMSRISLLLDRTFRKIGLNGKSLIPFIIGTGCSVPGIMGSRIIENEDERKMTAVLTPFVPCSAKLPIITLFTSTFFPDKSGLVSISLYFFAIIVIIMSALIIKKFKIKNESSTYISELPEYKLPNIRYILKDVWDKIIAFIKRAGSIVLICSIIIWFLVSFSFRLEYGVGIQNSILASIGKTISWIFYPIIGTNSWGATVSAIQGLVAKEQVVSSMAIISGLEEKVNQNAEIFKENGIFGFFTPSSAYAFMIFNLFSAPCIGAIGAMKKELGSIRKLLEAVFFQIGIAWILASMVYQIGIRIENGSLNISNIIILSIILIIVIGIILSKIKIKNRECCRCPYCGSCNKN